MTGGSKPYNFDSWKLMWILVTKKGKSFRYISMTIVLKSTLQKKQLTGICKTAGKGLYFGVLAKAMTGIKKSMNIFSCIWRVWYIF